MRRLGLSVRGQREKGDREQGSMAHEESGRTGRKAG
jgi:hypothetical protein